MEIKIKIENPLKLLKKKLQRFSGANVKSGVSKIHMPSIGLGLPPLRELWTRFLVKANKTVIWAYLSCSVILFLAALTNFVFFLYFAAGTYIGVRYLRLYEREKRRQQDGK